MLVDHELSGLVVGPDPRHPPEDIYRALLEATAFGTRVIVEAFAAGVPVTEFIVAGGLLKNQLLMQIYADVTGLPLSVVTSTRAPALGSAIHAAVAAGAYPDIRRRRQGDGQAEQAAYTPIPENVAAYDRLYAGVTASSTTTSAAGERRHAHASRPSAGRRTARRNDEPADRCRARHRRPCGCARGLRPARRADPLRAGGLDRRQRLRPRPGRRPHGHQAVGVSYDDLTPDAMVVTDLYGRLVEGDAPRPVSDTAAHAYVYRHMPEVGGVVHTHSTYATAWAARGEPIPCVLTMMGDEFGGAIPVGPFALIGDDSIGRGIVETLSSTVPGRPDAEPRPVHHRQGRPLAVKAAVMCEEVARTVHIARQLGEPLPIDPTDVDASTTATRTSTATRPDVLENPCPQANTLAQRVWFLTGSQGLYGEDVLKQVAAQSRRSPPPSTDHPRSRPEVVWKPVLTDSDAIRRTALEANSDDSVHRRDRLDAHLLPAKMWIRAWTRLQSRCCTCTPRPTATCPGRTSTSTS